MEGKSLFQSTKARGKGKISRWEWEKWGLWTGIGGSLEVSIDLDKLVEVTAFC